SYWVRPHRALATGAGHHRWIWDLRSQRPLASSYEYPISAVPRDTPREPEGPRVVPGTYTIKLTAGGKTLTTTVDVKLDPRIKLAPAVVTKIGQLEQRLADLVTRSSQLAMQAKSVSAQLGKLAPQPEPLKTQISDVSTKLAAIASDPPGPRGPAAPAR